MRNIHSCFRPHLTIPVHTQPSTPTSANSTKAQTSNQPELQTTKQFNQASIMEGHSIKGAEGGICTAITTRLMADFISKPDASFEQILDELSHPGILRQLADSQILYQKRLDDDINTGGMGFGPYQDAIYLMSEGKLGVGSALPISNDPEKIANIAITNIEYTPDSNRWGGAIVISFLDQKAENGNQAEQNHQILFAQEKTPQGTFVTKAFDPNQGVISIEYSDPNYGEEAIKKALKLYNIKGETSLLSATVQQFIKN